MIKGIEVEISRWGLSLVRDGEEIDLQANPGRPVTSDDQDRARALLSRASAQVYHMAWGKMPYCGSTERTRGVLVMEEAEFLKAPEGSTCEECRRKAAGR